MIYFINPSERGILENAGDRVPIGLCSIAGYLRTHGIESRIYDMNHIFTSVLINDIVNKTPEYVGISLYTTPLFNKVKSLSKTIREFSPKSKIIIGGYHPTALPETVQNLADYVVTGEGEQATLDIITQNVENKFVKRNVNLSNLTLPARDLLNMNNYNMKINGKRTGTLITSRGCCFDCIFCGKMDRTIRYNPLSLVEQEINQLINEYNYKNLYFLDDIFTVNKFRLKKITDMLKDKNITYRATTRADCRSLSRRSTRVLRDIASCAPRDRIMPGPSPWVSFSTVSSSAPDKGTTRRPPSRRRPRKL